MCRARSIRFVFRLCDFRIGDFRRLLRGLERDAGAAHALDVGDQCNFLGHCCGCASGGGCGSGRRCKRDGQIFRVSLPQCLPRSTFSAASWSPSACLPCIRKRADLRDHVSRYRGPALSGLGRLVHPGAAGPVQSPETSRQGNLLGMIGMVIAIRHHACRCWTSRACNRFLDPDHCRDRASAAASGL